MCDDDRCGSLEVYASCAMSIGLGFGSLQVYAICAIMVSLEVWKSGSLHVGCDDDKFGCSEVYTLCAMMIGLDVLRSTHCV